MASGRTTHLEGKPGHTKCGERAYPDTIVDSPKDATCFYCVTAWEKEHNAGSMYSRHLHASYDYDRRGVVADDATAMVPRPPKVKPIVPREEQHEALKHLSEVWSIVKEWVIHSNPEFVNGHEYGATNETYEKMAAFRDWYDTVTEKFRRLGARGPM